jgi:PAS domain S-box-containing protein
MTLEAETQPEPDIFQKAMGLAKENLRLTHERERAEEQLLQATQQKALILNSVGEGIYGLDLEGNTTFANPAAEKILGYTEAELIGKPQHGIIHHFKQDGLPFPREDCHFCAAFNDGREYRESEDVFWRKDGTPFPVEFVSTPIHENEKLIGAVVTFNDITERKNAEAQSQLQYELTQVFLDGHSLEKTIPRILEAIGLFMKWEISHYWEKKSESEELHCRYAWSAECLNENTALKEFKKISFQKTFKKGTGLPGQVWEKLEPSWVPDVRIDKNFPRAPLAINLRMKTGFGFPILSNNQFVGVIEIFTRQQCLPNSQLIRLMTHLGAQIGQWMRLKKAEEHLEKLNLITPD